MDFLRNAGECRPGGAGEPPEHPPVKRPTEIIPETETPPSSGLSLKPPTKSGLRELITEQGTDQKPK